MIRILPSKISRRSLLFLAALTTLAASALPISPGQPELFSTFMQKVSTTPEFRDRILTASKSIPKIGDWLSPDMIDNLRSAVLGKNWQRVDHFPALTVDALNHGVDVAARLAGNSKKQLKLSDIVDTGSFSLTQPQTIDLNHPATAPSYADDPDTAVTHPVPGVTMGDGPDPRLAPMHAESKRIAEVLNRLALNSPRAPQLAVLFAGQRITDPGTLIKVFASSHHQVTVDDDLYFANFGHLHDGPIDVMMPFWLDAQVVIPGTRRSLLMPVSHSEHELHIRGPIINADVSHYFGIDGKSEFRTMDSLNQPWVLGRQAFTYTGDRAAEAINLLAQATRVYSAIRLAHPELPFGGYYTLGVCQDINAALEQDLQGRVILFPLTRDPRYFPSDPAVLHLEPRDAQFLRLLSLAPDDRGHSHAPIARLLGALPTTDPSAILIPGLASDIERVQHARTTGSLRRTRPFLLYALFTFIAISLFFLIVRRSKRRN